MSNPEILWAQDRELIFLTVKIPQFNLTKYNLEERKLVIEGEEGKDKERFYMELDLYSDVKIETDNYETTENKIFITLRKTSRQFWNRLTKFKQNNIKIDWQRWVLDEDEDESEDDDLIQNFNDFKKTLPSELLETDFSQLLPDMNDNLEYLDDTELADIKQSEDTNEGKPETEIKTETETETIVVEEEGVGRGDDSIDDGFLANGEESYTETSTEEVFNINPVSELQLDELDIEKLDADLDADLHTD